MMTSTVVTIRECTDPTELYRHYQGQSEPQSAYIALDLEDGRMWADYDAEVGNGVPESVFHGRDRRYGIPLLTAAAANDLMRELAPLAQRVVDGSDIEWDGNNRVARLNDDAQAAEAEIDARLGNGYDSGPVDAYFSPDQLIAVWDVAEALNGQEAGEYGITAGTSDERLDEIEKDILSSLTACGEAGVVVCTGLEEHLRRLRDQAAEEFRDVYWSVMRGTSPDSDAVQPEPAGITVPDDVLEWASGHGLADDDPDVYLVVAPQEGATDMQGEIAFTEGRLSMVDGAALHKALAEQAAERAERNADLSQA